MTYMNKRWGLLWVYGTEFQFCLNRVLIWKYVDLALRPAMRVAVVNSIDFVRIQPIQDFKT
jgi:hypothetical protein